MNFPTTNKPWYIGENNTAKKINEAKVNNDINNYFLFTIIIWWNNLIQNVSRQSYIG